jgi:RNA polymerase sigma factor (sigma-70 family)
MPRPVSLHSGPTRLKRNRNGLFGNSGDVLKDRVSNTLMYSGYSLVGLCFRRHRVTLKRKSLAEKILYRRLISEKSENPGCNLTIPRKGDKVFYAQPHDRSTITTRNPGFGKERVHDSAPPLPSQRTNKSSHADPRIVQCTIKRISQGCSVHPAEERLKALFVAGLDGDTPANRAFLNALAGHLRGFLRKRIDYRRDDIEDIVQEILFAVHNNRHTYRTDEPLTPWVHAIARYKLMDFYRARSRCEALNDPLDDYIDAFANSDVEPADAKRDIGKLLEQLPDCHRLPIMHMKLHGLSVTETAELTGMSESAVKVGVHRGLKALVAKIRGVA